MPYAPWSERGSIRHGEFRWRLGVRPLDLANWIEFGPDCDGPDGWLAEKQRVLADHASTAFAVLDGIDDEASEVADAVVAHLGEHSPDRPRGIDVSLHPLDAAARLVPEDLALMVERDGRLVFGGGSICFPNRWDLASKLGATMAEVHEPVARLNDQLETAVDDFLSRLKPERSFWRLGWGILDVPDGYTPLDGTGPARPESPAPSELFVRVERETLRRFPETRCVLFTIRTYVAPLRSVAGDAVSAAALGAALDAMTDDVRGYKDLLELAGPLVRHLAH